MRAEREQQGIANLSGAEDGRLIVVIYEILDDLTVYPVTAYEIAP